MRGQFSCETCVDGVSTLASQQATPRKTYFTNKLSSIYVWLSFTAHYMLLVSILNIVTVILTESWFENTLSCRVVVSSCRREYCLIF